MVDTFPKITYEYMTVKAYLHSAVLADACHMQFSYKMLQHISYNVN